MSKKKSNTSKKSRKAKYRQSKKTDGVLKRPKELQRRNFMDLTPSQDEPVPQAQPQDPSTQEYTGASLDEPPTNDAALDESGGNWKVTEATKVFASLRSSVAKIVIYGKLTSLFPF